MGVLLIGGALIIHAAIPRYEYRDIVSDGDTTLSVVDNAKKAQDHLNWLLSKNMLLGLNQSDWEKRLKSLSREELIAINQADEAVKANQNQSPQWVTVQLQVDHWIGRARIVLVDQYGWRRLP